MKVTDIINLINDNITHKRFALVLIGASIFLISVLNCYAGYMIMDVYICLNRLYALPIAYAALIFGLKGGLITAAISTVSIWISTHLGYHIANFNNTVIEIGLFFLLAWFVSYYIRQEKKQKEKIKQQKEQIDQLEKQMTRAEKLSAMGTLIAGVAHEIRNPLSIIQIATENLANKKAKDEKVTEYTEAILKETQRLDKTINEFLDFAQPTEVEFETIDIKQLIDEVLVLTKKYLDKNDVELITSLEDNLPLIRGAENQLKQVFINLVLNAIEAMRDTENKELKLKVYQGNKYIKIIIADNGCGIAEDELDKIFEPFFTTKDEGSGLGLSTVHRLIDLHNGFIEVDSRLGEGSTFKIGLPIKIRR